jgi:predicted enzyme related to lactoylglutathione lyase
VWFDLLANDPAAAIAFYTKLVGWSTTPFEMPDAPPYMMWTRGATPVGGVMQQQPGQPTSWLAYVTVPDVDETLRTVERLGGRVLAPARDIPTVGRFAVFADPQGAVISAFAPTGEPTPDVMPQVGEFSWNELSTTDPVAAFTFYQAVFGWEKGAAHDMGPMSGIYQLFGRNGRDVGGIFNPGAQAMGAPSWLHYVKIADVDPTVKQIPKLGGQVFHGPVDVPGGSRIVVGADSQGAPFAVVSGP